MYRIFLFQLMSSQLHLSADTALSYCLSLQCAAKSGHVGFIIYLFIEIGKVNFFPEAKWITM